VTVDGDTEVRAVFDVVPVTRQLAVRTVGARGTVTSTPSGIDCGTSCAASFADGARVTLSASAGRGSVFAGWQGAACPGTGPCTVTLRRDTTVEARFDQAATTHLLTVETDGDGGTVTSVPSGIDCGRSCRGSFAEGTTVTLTATTVKDAAFVGWRGAAGCSGTGPCTVAMSEDRSVTAVFRPPRTLTVVRKVEGGTVTSAPAGIACGTSCSASFTEGTRVTLTAVGNADLSFDGWSGPCEGKPTNTCVVRLTRDVTVTAKFSFIIG
jgi:hypothetical protein